MHNGVVKESMGCMIPTEPAQLHSEAVRVRLEKISKET